MAVENKRQHWVPQFYLRYFATPETRPAESPLIWATPVEEGKVLYTSTRVLAAKSFLYSPSLDDGSRDDRVDARLRDLEGFMGLLWPRIADNHICLDDSFRKGMSLFLATLILRHPRLLQFHRNFYAQAALGSSRGAGETARALPDRIESMAHRSFVANILALGGEFAQVLYQRKPWNVVFADDPVFATSDHPVVLFDEVQEQPGIGRKETSVYFPISPTRLLLIGHEGWNDGTMQPMRRGGEGLFNFLIGRNAHRFLFSTSEPTNVFEGIVKYGRILTGQVAPETALSWLGAHATRVKP